MVITMSLFVRRTRPIKLVSLAVSLALAGSWLLPDARAASTTSTTSITSTDPDPTWGTDFTPDGRAQRVSAIAVVGRKVFLGGEFTAMVPPGGGPARAAKTRNHLAALDVDTHALLPWDPDADGTVRALVLSADGTKLYVGGDFDHIGGMPASKLALVDLKTGKVDPGFGSGVRGPVKALALAGDRLYVGGIFDAVAGPAGDEPRPKLAALDAATGELLPWTPPRLGPGRYVGHDGVPTPGDWSGDVNAIAVPPEGSRVYVAGSFLDFAAQGGLVVLDAATGHALPQQWTVGRPLFDLAVSPADHQTVFASAGGPGGMVYAFRPTQPKSPLWSTWVDGDAPGLAASATTVYLMGHYDYAGPGNLLRHHLAAFNAASGAVDAWDPAANTPTGAFSAAVGADHVFVGGDFTTINNRPQPGFAQFPIATPTTSSTTTSTSTTSTSTTSTSTTSTSTTSTSTTSTTGLTTKKP
jgi:hypothetical protein